jgi:hypothetical protein
VDEWVAILAIVFFGCFVVAVVALQFLRTDYDPLSHFVSDYAVGPYGEVMSSAFISMSLGALFLLVGLVRRGPKTAFFRISLLFLAVFVPGIFVAALFPTDLPGAPSTTHGRIHDLDATINFLSLIVASVLLSIAFGGDERWRSFRAHALLIAFGVVAAFVTLFLTVNSQYRHSLGGLANKALTSLLLIWLLATSNQLRTVARRTQGTSD